MKRQVFGLLALGMSVLLGNTQIVTAGMVVNQNTDLVSNPAKVTVIAEMAGEYSVIIPKELEMVRQEDGSYWCDYTVDVNGTIANESYVSVIPQSEISMSTEGKDDVMVVVTQGTKYFRSSSYKGDLSGSTDTTKIDSTNTTPEASGSLTEKEGYKFTSGTWKGILLFDIQLNWDDVEGVM